MRLQMHKMSVDDFELPTMIGKGAFGEVEHVKIERNLLVEVDSECIVKLYFRFKMKSCFDHGIPTWWKPKDVADEKGYLD